MQEYDMQQCVESREESAQQAEGAAMTAINARLVELKAAYEHYVCVFEGMHSVYIKENGRHGNSPWAEFIDAVRAVAELAE